MESSKTDSDLISITNRLIARVKTVEEVILGLSLDFVSGFAVIFVNQCCVLCIYVVPNGNVLIDAMIYCLSMR